MTEYVDIVDESNKVIKTVTRKEMREKDLLHRTSYVIVFNSKGEILITKRSMSKDAYPGMYELTCGGTVDAGESYEENAYRELGEERGIKNIKLKFLFEFRYKDKVQNCIGRVYTCVYDGKIIPQKEEVESYFFISFEDLKKMIKEKEFSPSNIEIFKRYLKMVKR